MKLCRSEWNESANTLRPAALFSLFSRITCCSICAASSILRKCFDKSLTLCCASVGKRNALSLSGVGRFSKIIFKRRMNDGRDFGAGLALLEQDRFDLRDKIDVLPLQPCAIAQARTGIERREDQPLQFAVGYTQSSLTCSGVNVDL